MTLLSKEMFNTMSSYILGMGELMCTKYNERNHSIFLIESGDAIVLPLSLGFRGMAK